LSNDQQGKSFLTATAVMRSHPTEARIDLAHDLVLPTLLFAVLGAMTWAIRGCSGFGAMNGCVFAGVTWGTAWWFIARDTSRTQSRPYSSGWIILALTVGIGIAGNRGWMQWPSFFEGHLQTNTAQGKFVPVPRSYGFLWLFIAGVPWAGLGACMLAWCGSHRTTKAWLWFVRIACGVAMAAFARFLFESFPDFFLPLHKSLQSQYADLQANPNLRRLINDNRAAIMHLGLYLGFLAFEAGRRDWRNVVLISTVGLLNGFGWAACQNWRWAAPLWPNANFNWWRCWESSGGISIGIAYGIAYFLVNRRMAAEGASPGSERPAAQSPNWERFGAYTGLVFGLGLSIRNGLKGWANIYVGNENYWNHVLWMIIGPLMLLTLAGLAIRLRLRPVPPEFPDDVFPHAYRLIWMVLIIQNVIAQMVTGPHSSWNETAFSIYYVLLFLISALIVYHYRWFATSCRVPSPVFGQSDGSPA
jgi:MFS family permease